MKWIVRFVIVAIFIATSMAEICLAQYTRSIVIRGGKPVAMKHFAGGWAEIVPVYKDAELTVYWNESDINHILFQTNYAETGTFAADILMEFTGEKLRQEIIKYAIEAPKEKHSGPPVHLELLRYRKWLFVFDPRKGTIKNIFGCYLDRDGDPVLCKPYDDSGKKPPAEEKMGPRYQKIADKLVAILERIRKDPKTADEIAVFRKSTGR